MKITNEKHIQYFPSNVLTKIFSYLDDEDMCNNIPFVCRKWRLASSKSPMIRHASFSGKTVSSMDINEVLQNARSVKSVSLFSVDDVVPVLRKICRSNKDVEKIKLKHCKSEWGIVPEESLINVLLSLPKLRSIELNNTKFQSHTFFEVVATQTNITSIDISSNEYVTLSDLMTLVHNGKIVEFKLSRRCKQPVISDQEMAHLIKSLKLNLRLLHLDMSGLGNYTYNEVFSCSKIIDLKMNNAMNLSADLLRKLYSNLTQLQKLKIEGPTMLTTGDLFNSLFRNHPLPQRLQSLKLENLDTLNDTECCSILTVCTNLKVLSYKGCKSLTLEGIITLLMGMPELEYLNISNIGKSDGVRYLIQNHNKLSAIVIDTPSYKLNNLSMCIGNGVKVVKLSSKK